MNEKEFNAIFDEAFENVVSEVDIDIVPDYTTAWGKTRVQMKNQRVRKNRFKKIQIASGIAGMILIGSIVFSLPVVSDALSPMMARIAETRDQIVDVFTKEDEETFEDGMKTAPPPDDAGDVIPKSETDTSSSRFDDNGINEKWTSLKDYKANINGFPLKDINYIPENYIFSEVRLYSSKTVILARFKFINSQGTPLSLKAESKNIQDPVVPLDTENYKYEEKTLQNGSVAKLFLFENGDIKVHVFVDHLSLELFGEVPKEKAIQLMEGLIIE